MNDRYKAYRILFVLVLLISAIPMLVSSCIGESQSNKGYDNAATVRINMQVPQQKNVLTRTQTLSENESTINDMTVLIFNADNKLIGYGYSATPTPTNNIYQMTVNTREATGCTVYVVANAGANAFTIGNSTVSGVSNPVNTLDEFTVAYTKLSTASDLGSQNNVIMSGVLKNQDITASTQTLATTVPLYRLCTKINFNINPSSDIKITSYQLHEVPTSSYIADRSAETTPAYNPSNSYKDFDKVTESSPTNGSEVTNTYYIYENLAGTVSASNTAKTRNSQNAPVTATYLDVCATGSNWQSIYRIYLGGTGTTDYTNYNIPRNYNYTYTINITGSGVYDVRVTCYPELINSASANTWGSNGNATTTSTVKIGDYYFTDGSWGTLTEHVTSTVKPIGVIFSTRISNEEKNAGFTHGYALALQDANSTGCYWSTSGNDLSFLNDVTYLSAYYNDLSSGYVGTFANSLGTNSNYPAWYYAYQYKNTVAAPSYSSGWYLPTGGQWWDVMNNLGKVDFGSFTSITNSEVIQYGSSTALSNINSYLTAASGGSAISSGSWYWSSSEVRDIGAVHVRFHDTYLLLSGSGDPYVKYGGSYKIRSIIAF